MQEQTIEVEIGGKQVSVTIVEPTLRQMTAIYSKYLRPTLSVDKRTPPKEVQVDMFAMALDMMTVVAKKVVVDGQTVEIRRVEDWDKVDEIDTRIARALMSLMMERFRVEAELYGVGKNNMEDKVLAV